MARSGPKSVGSIDTSDAVEAQLLTRMDSGGYDPETEAAFEQFKEDLRTHNTEGTLWVYRMPLDDRGELIANAKNSILFTAPIQRYSLEELVSKVQSEYMLPGERKTCIRIAGTKKGERGVRFNTVMIVEVSTRVPEVKADPARESIGELMRALQDQQKATVAMVREMLTQHPAAPAVPVQPPIGQLRELAEIMFLLNGGQSKTAAVAASAPPATVLDQLKTLRELRGFVTELAGDGEGLEAEGEGGAGALSVLKHLSPWAQVFGHLLQRQAAGVPPMRRLARAPQSIAAPGRPPIAGAPGQPAAAHAPGIAPMTPLAPASQLSTPAAPEELDPVLAQMREQFAALTKAAEEGSDPMQMAGVVLNMVPDGSAAEGALLGLLDEPNWFGRITTVYPPAAPHQAWFAQLRLAILAEYVDENDAPGTAVVPVE
jgi:hypothetical protein